MKKLIYTLFFEILKFLSRQDINEKSHRLTLQNYIEKSSFSTPAQ